MINFRLSSKISKFFLYLYLSMQSKTPAEDLALNCLDIIISFLNRKLRLPIQCICRGYKWFSMVRKMFILIKIYISPLPVAQVSLQIHI